MNHKIKLISLSLTVIFLLKINSPTIDQYNSVTSQKLDRNVNSLIETKLHSQHTHSKKGMWEQANASIELLSNK